MAVRIVKESFNTFALAWQEFDRNDRPVGKTKEFSSEAAMIKFADKVEQKNNFYRILGYSYPDGYEPKSESKKPVKEVREPKQYTIRVSRHGKDDKYVTNTLDKLIGYFSYTLLKGNSWDRSINKNPKTAAALVNALNKSNAVSTTHYRNEFYYLVDAPDAPDTQEFPAEATLADLRKNPTFGKDFTFKH